MKRKPSKSELETITIWLTRESIVKLRRMAHAEDRSVGAVLRRLIALGLKPDNRAAVDPDNPREENP